MATLNDIEVDSITSDLDRIIEDARAARKDPFDNILAYFDENPDAAVQLGELQNDIFASVDEVAFQNGQLPDNAYFKMGDDTPGYLRGFDLGRHNNEPEYDGFSDTYGFGM